MAPGAARVVPGAGMPIRKKKPPQPPPPQPRAAAAAVAGGGRGRLLVTFAVQFPPELSPGQRLQLHACL